MVDLVLQTQEHKLALCCATDCLQHVLRTCVHVLYPDCINRTIQNQPLPVWTRVRCQTSEGYSKDAILPLLCCFITLACTFHRSHKTGSECMAVFWSQQAGRYKRMGKQLQMC